MPKASISAAFTMLSAVHEPKIKSDAHGLYLEDMLQDAFEKEAVNFKQMRDLYRVNVAGVDS